MMTRLSVNINKVALLRNARGGNIPDILRFARDCEAAGAQGITVHPRPDERHIRKSDVYALKEVVSTEFNIEGNPTEDFLRMVLEVQPQQCTLVPDAPAQLTSDHGWDTVTHRTKLQEAVARLHEKNIRVSLFADPLPEMLEGAKACGADRVELYTGPYAEHFFENKEDAVKAYRNAGELCSRIQLEVNAGHDLNLDNLQFFCRNVMNVKEVSIGHALIRDCLYYGLQNTIQLYLRQLQPAP